MRGAAITFAYLATGPLACVPYDAELAQAQDSGDSNALVGTPCETPNTARIRVEEFAFIVECGCAEAAGDTSRQCTVPAGTLIDWVFAGSVAHNVTSDDSDFASSPDRRRGQYPVRFDQPGTYPYGCSLHAGPMSNYRIVVRPATQ